MARQAVQVDGLRELDKALLDLRQEMNLSRASVKNTFKRAMKQAVTPVSDSAKALAPKRSGALAESIEISGNLSRRQKAKHHRESELEMFVGAKALPHAHLQEFGTSHHAAHPFLRPAWDTKRFGVLTDMKKFLWREIEKTAERARRKAARLAAKATRA